jgi:hypothetical protein
MLFRGLTFCFNYCVALGCTFFGVLFIGYVSGLNPGYLSLMVLPLLIAAMVEGKVYARDNGDKPRACQACFAALQMMVLALGLGAAFLALVKALVPHVLVLIGLTGIEVTAITGVGFAIATIFTLRLGYGFGLTTALKERRYSQL